MAHSILLACFCVVNFTLLEIFTLNELYLKLFVELNGIWVRALLGPVHLGLQTGPLCPMFYY